MSDEKVGVSERAVGPVAVDYTAPTIAFDNFSTVGHLHGMFSIILSLGRPTALTDNSVPTVHRIACQLYGNREAMLILRHAIDSALLLGEPTAETKN